MAVIGRVKHLVFLAILLSNASCATHPRDRSVIMISFNAAAEQCILTHDGETIRFRWGDPGSPVALAARQWSAKHVVVRGGPNVPYKCIGEAIFELQRTAKRIDYIAEPVTP